MPLHNKLIIIVSVDMTSMPLGYSIINYFEIYSAQECVFLVRFTRQVFVVHPLTPVDRDVDVLKLWEKEIGERKRRREPIARLVIALQ